VAELKEKWQKVLVGDGDNQLNYYTRCKKMERMLDVLWWRLWW
jgi:hypothetical protein